MFFCRNKLRKKHIQEKYNPLLMPQSHTHLRTLRMIRKARPQRSVHSVTIRISSAESVTVRILSARVVPSAPKF